MKMVWAMIAVILLAGGVILLLVRGGPAPPAPPAPPATAPEFRPVRIALIPERDVFAQRRRYRALADYVSGKVGRPVELVTLSSYDAVLAEFAQERIDAAFLGSLVAVLAVDRLGARIVANPQMLDGTQTYRGVIFALESSPLRTVDDLAGRSVAMVRTTTGGNLFPIEQFVKHGLLGSSRSPRMVWMGTHEDAIDAVANGQVEAGAVKDLVLDAWCAAHTDKPMRRMATSGSVPTNALVVRGSEAQLGQRIGRVLLEMDRDAAGQEALRTYGASKFVPCGIEDYGVIFDVVERMGDAWAYLGVQGPPPRRPASRPAAP